MNPKTKGPQYTPSDESEEADDEKENADLVLEKKQATIKQKHEEELKESLRILEKEKAKERQIQLQKDKKEKILEIEKKRKKEKKRKLSLLKNKTEHKDKDQKNKKQKPTFWLHQELSWVPEHLRDRKLGSSVLTLPKSLNVEDGKEITYFATDDNIGEKFYSQTNGYPPIDAVVMWVNGSDPLFKQEKNQEMSKFKDCALDCIYPITTKMNWCCPTQNKQETETRFNNHDELKYVFRSIEENAPWIRKIYLVTNNQIPNWLNIYNKRIEVVLPSEFVKYPDELPTFSSPSLESQLHLIKGVSRFFLYFNDDFFIVNPVWPSDFLTLENEYILRFDWDIQKSDLKLYDKRRKQLSLSYKSDIYEESLKYTDTIFDLTFGKRERKSAVHAPTLIDRDIMERIWSEWPKIIEDTARAKFRLGDQMHYQTTYFNYIRDCWIDYDFCNYFYLNFDLNNDRYFDNDEIKKITKKISQHFDKDENDLYLQITYQINEIQLLENNNENDNYRAHDLDLKVNCTILKKIPIIMDYQTQVNVKAKSRTPNRLYKNKNAFNDVKFSPIYSTKGLQKAFKYINKRFYRFLSINDNFKYDDLYELIEYNNVFTQSLNSLFPKKSQFEFDGGEVNKDLRLD
ncbi:hypothetical protein M0813_08444 [Anaeramoeba flamelloides]|uniref:Uncharacterized protein n=1 Tax=Anaeramoeba flamelloides TaxID=1746091 RepID=A0ABQ8X9H4_9EUKA|nr:hypothetical protein M0813_08444 [Anaeramoeba flamelloides]